VAVHFGSQGELRGGGGTRGEAELTFQRVPPYGHVPMALRTKLLVLFLLLGVLPLLALGLLNYVQSTRALEDLLAARAKATASKVAEALSHRYSLATSDLQFLAENAESQRLLRGREGSGEALSDSSRQVAESFLDEAWGTIGPAWRWVEIRDSTGA